MGEGAKCGGAEREASPTCCGGHFFTLDRKKLYKIEKKFFSTPLENLGVLVRVSQQVAGLITKDETRWLGEDVSVRAWCVRAYVCVCVGGEGDARWVLTV